MAPDGSDQGPGTAAQPFRSLARARGALRRYLKGDAAPAAPAAVVVHGGRYELGEPFVVAWEDSGTEAAPVTYRAADGETPVLSGGRAITGWRPGENGVWTASVPEAAAGKWPFRQLFVNGRRAVRARTPNKSDKDYCWRVQGATLTKDLKTHSVTVGPGRVARWERLGEVELIVLKNWATLHKRIQSVDPATGSITLVPPHVKYFSGNRAKRGTACFVENAREFLDAPGEWYLDPDAGTVHYMPLPGEDMTAADVVVPVLDRVVDLRGTKDSPVRYVIFEGLGFMHNDYGLPPEGHHGRQGAFRYNGDGVYGMPGMVQWEFAEHCALVGCTVAHAGSSGVFLRQGCHENRLEGNTVSDIAGNGISLGGPNDDALVPTGNRIANNHVHHCGEVYYGACGIWAGFARKTVIEHNLVCHLPYTGISIGWVWSAKPSVVREMTVAWNEIHDVMRQVSDGGGIYSLGWQPGTVVRCNHVYDVRRGRFAHAAPNNGFFLDQGSKEFVIERNLFYRTSGKPVRHNQNSPEWHTWRHNVLRAATSVRYGRGRTGNGLGGGHIETPHSAELEPETLTLMTWVRLESVPGGADPRVWIANKNGDEWQDGYYGLALAEDVPGAYINIGGNRANRIWLGAEEHALSVGQWHHLAMAYDGADLHVYVDGKPAGHQTVGKRRSPGTGAFVIGRRADGFGRREFPGTIDGTRLYRRALSPAHIAVSAADPRAGVAGDDLAKCWEFEEAAHPAPDLDDVRRGAGLEPAWKGISRRAITDH